MKESEMTRTQFDVAQTEFKETIIKIEIVANDYLELISSRQC